MPSLNPRITDWRSQHVWLLGASAGIGEALALALSRQGATLTLSARNTEALRSLATRCGGNTRVLACDVTDAASLDTCFAQLDADAAAMPTLGIYLAGDYQPLDGALGEAVLPALRKIMAVNYSGAVEWAMRCAQRLMQRRAAGDPRPMGIALVASVAGYQGLPKALGYSPSKAALIRFSECLQLDLAPQGLGVWVINPGFVATRLTAQNDFHMPALISPEQAAHETLRGLASGAFEIHYPKRFTRLMKLLAVLPYGLSMRLLRRMRS